MAGRHGGLEDQWTATTSQSSPRSSEIEEMKFAGFLQVVALMPQIVFETHIGLTLSEVSIPEAWLHAKCYDITLHLTIPSFLAQV